MKASMKKKRGVVGAIVLAGILSVGGYALTNSVTFAKKTIAGYGQQALEVVNVTDTGWELDTTDPSKVKELTFAITSVTFGANGGEAWVRNRQTAGTWVKCTDPATGAVTKITCPLSPMWDVQDVGENDTLQNNTPGSNTVAGGIENIELVVAEKKIP